MKIETWNYNGKEVQVPILEDSEKENDIELEEELEKTQDLSKVLDIYMKEEEDE